MTCLLKITGYYSAPKNYAPGEILVILELPINDALKYRDFVAKNPDLNPFNDFEDLIDGNLEIVSDEVIMKGVKAFFKMNTKYSNTSYDFIKRMDYIMKCVEYKDILKEFLRTNNAPLEITKKFIERLEDIVENKYTYIISQMILNEVEKFLELLYLGRMQNKLLEHINSDLLSLIASYLSIETYRKEMEDIYPNLYKIKGSSKSKIDDGCINVHKSGPKKGLSCGKPKLPRKAYCGQCNKFVNNLDDNNYTGYNGKKNNELQINVRVDKRFEGYYLENTTNLIFRMVGSDYVFYAKLSEDGKDVLRVSSTDIAYAKELTMTQASKDDEDLKFEIFAFLVKTQ